MTTRTLRLLAALLGWVGLGMVLASLLVIDADTLFPGTWALLPTVGAALVLVAGPAAGSWGPVAVLRHAVLQWVGRLSYSLYLWHWPFVAVVASFGTGTVIGVDQDQVRQVEGFGADSDRRQHDDENYGGLE